MPFTLQTVLSFVCMLAVLAGCSSEGPEITGLVTLDGRALSKARVAFEPVTQQKAAYSAMAVCDEQGAFTVVPQSAGRTLEPGTYGVTISRKTDPQGNVPTDEDYGQYEAAGALLESVPGKYTSIQPGGAYTLTVEIGKGSVEPLDLQLTSQ
ncbi:MAG TPA: hypothetical protein VFV87_03935 [Pirellulaceae bacterium]|nr:hypothetical protein [Pirellulaceae bacterium]